MQAPKAWDLLNQAVVQQALQDAWSDSLSEDPVLRHEEGGWIYMNPATGEVLVRRAPSGQQSIIDVSVPPVDADAVVGGLSGGPGYQP